MNLACSFLLICCFLLSSGCRKFLKTGSGGGGNPNSILSANEMNDLLNITTDPPHSCSSEEASYDNHKRTIPDIPPNKGKWEARYNKLIWDNLDKPDFAPLMKYPLNQSDLGTLGCSSFNELDEANKKKFWVYFFAALGRQETDWDATNDTGDGGDSIGLMQLGVGSSNMHCKKRMQLERDVIKEDLLNPEFNITCSMHTLVNQISGSPTIKNGKIVKNWPDLEGRLLTARSYIWAPLNPSTTGYPRFSSWLRPMLNRFVPACNNKDLIKKPKCDDTVSNLQRQNGKGVIEGESGAETNDEAINKKQ